MSWFPSTSALAPRDMRRGDSVTCPMGTQGGFWWEFQPMVNISLNHWAGNFSAALGTICQWQLNKFLITFTEGWRTVFFLPRSVPPTYKCHFVLGCFANVIYYRPRYYMPFPNDFFINSKRLFGPFQIAKEWAKSDSLTYLLRSVYSDYHPLQLRNGFVYSE